jgi:hypothetical protein
MCHTRTRADKRGSYRTPRILGHTVPRIASSHTRKRPRHPPRPVLGTTRTASPFAFFATFITFALKAQTKVGSEI